MTNTEIRDALRDASRLVNTMDKVHVKRMLQILVDAQSKKDCASLLFIDLKKTVKKLLNDFIKIDHVNNYLKRRHMKQIFVILGDYGIYPVCKLCGQPIKISTDNNLGSEQVSFSWDHITPKSKGGSYDLANLQPAHKICNNKRGTEPLYSRHYKIKMHINIDVVFDLNDLCDGKNPRYRPDRFGLRKQDSWCHKQSCCGRQR